MDIHSGATMSSTENVNCVTGKPGLTDKRGADSTMPRIDDALNASGLTVGDKFKGYFK